MSNIAFLFMPPWTPNAHNYTIALFEAISRNFSIKLNIMDLNSDLYNEIDKSKKHLWNDDVHSEDWYLRKIYFNIFENKSDYLKNYFLSALDDETKACCFSVRNNSLPFAYQCARCIRNMYPEIPIVFGGPACFSEAHNTKILDDEGSVTAIVAGEGEIAWQEFLKEIDSEQLYQTASNFTTSVHGFIFRNNLGQIHTNPPIQKLRNFTAVNRIQYRNLARVSNQSNIFALETSRGCVNHCAFCSESNNYAPYRTKSAEHIFEELCNITEFFKETNDNCDLTKPHIHIVDSLFNGHMKIFKQWMDKVIDSKLDISWAGMAILRKEMTNDILETMKNSGCTSVMWGLESGSATTLQHMRKTRFSLDHAVKIFSFCHTIGIQQSANFIVGFPTETEEHFKESLNFAKKIQPYFQRIGSPAMLVLPNAPVYKEAELFGITDKDKVETWQSQNGANNLEVREDRVKRLQEILSPDKHFMNRRMSHEKSM